MRDADDLFSRIRIGRSTKNYPTNQEVFIQGELADLVFFIIEGRIKLTVLSEHGKDAVIGIVEEGQFFWRGVPSRSAGAARYGGHARTLPHHLDNKSCDAFSNSGRTGALETISQLPIKPE